ncbi:branched-chain amino acid ABC transporter substrate-binding protein [Zavarzinia sp.]|uniref:branched-chain amino acid ABC transporter substrate-binding protein n=1 Tax=Zavarzinia sp. TaxID=2027920 RepID=UPI003563A7A6
MKKLIAALVAIVVIAVGVYFLFIKKPPAPPVAADITIATAGPMTGQYAAFGEQMKRGAEQAVADINAAGGINGRKLKLEVGDDACDPKQAVAVANDLVNKGVVFVAGHFCSSSSIPASAVYNENNILQMSPASTNPKLTDEAAQKGWTNIFRTCGRDDYQGATASKYIVDHFPGKKVAVLNDKSAYGKGLADETAKGLTAKGAAPAMEEAYTQGDKDFSALISKMKAAGIEVVYIGGYHSEAGLIIRQSKEQGLAATFISGDAQNTAELWSITGDAGEGFLFTFAPDPRLKPTAAQVVDAFKKAGYDPEGYTLYTYAAVQVWAEAVKAVGGTDTAKVAAAIRAGSFPTVLGTLGFDAKGDVKDPEYVMYEWSKGQYAEKK